MGKKRKRKKRNYLTEWDGKFYGSNTNQFNPYIIQKHAQPQDIHDAAEKIFGQTYYIDFSETN